MDLFHKVKIPGRVADEAVSAPRKARALKRPDAGLQIAGVVLAFLRHDHIIVDLIEPALCLLLAASVLRDHDHPADELADAAPVRHNIIEVIGIEIRKINSSGHGIDCKDQQLTAPGVPPGSLPLLLHLPVEPHKIPAGERHLPQPLQIHGLMVRSHPILHKVLRHQPAPVADKPGKKVIAVSPGVQVEHIQVVQHAPCRRRGVSRICQNDIVPVLVRVKGKIFEVFQSAYRVHAFPSAFSWLIAVSALSLCKQFATKSAGSPLFVNHYKTRQKTGHPACIIAQTGCPVLTFIFTNLRQPPALPGGTAASTCRSGTAPQRTRS